uniref:alpha-glucosidase n=1 Tax=Culicoides sonorensis TaxID=179676 RepID=Q66UC5_CULSO|nr:maltase [Culicoides sonorensis]
MIPFKKLTILLSIACSVLAAPEGAREKDWWEIGNFYQVYPRSFMDSDGDGVGDLKGISEKVGYLKEIGMDGVWLSPIFDSPMADFGYDISNFTKVFPQFGDLSSIDELVAEFNKKDMKLILDFVPNHTSDQCEWFKKSIQRDPEYNDYYIWHPGKPNPDGGRNLPPTNWVSAFRSSAWEWNEERGEYYLHQFLAQQPDLNYRNPKVVETMKNVLRFWLSKGINGFRIDAVPYLFEVGPDANGNYPDEIETHACSDPLSQCYLYHDYTQNRPETFEMVTEWRATLEEFKQKNGGPTRVLMVEAYAPLTKVIQIYGQNGQLNGAQIPFNFEFLNNLGAVSNARDFKDVIDNYLSTIPEGATPNWVQGNHDQHRSASRLGPQKADAVNMLLQVLPGAAVTYYGEELAMEDVFVPWSRTVDPQACTTDPNIFHAKSRDPARTPMIWTSQKNAGFSSSNYTWLPTGPDYRKNNVEVQRSQRGSHLNIFKKLTQLRKQDILMYGTYDSYLANDDVLVIKREIENNRTLIAVLNLGFTEQVVNLNLNDRDWKVPERMEVATASVNAGMFERQPVVTSEVYVSAGVGVVLDYQVGRQIPEPRGDDPGLYE